jgi:hypothetical protein
MAAFVRQAPTVARPSNSAVKKSNLPPAVDVIKFQLRVNLHVKLLLAEDVRLYGGMFRQETAKASRDCCLLACEFGYIPPLRLSVIARLKHPDHVQQGECDDEDCRWVAENAVMTCAAQGCCCYCCCCCCCCCYCCYASK